MLILFSIDLHDKSTSDNFHLRPRCSPPHRTIELTKELRLVKFAQLFYVRKRVFVKKRFGIDREIRHLFMINLYI